MEAKDKNNILKKIRRDESVETRRLSSIKHVIFNNKKKCVKAIK